MVEITPGSTNSNDTEPTKKNDEFRALSEEDKKLWRTLFEISKTTPGQINIKEPDGEWRIATPEEAGAKFARWNSLLRKYGNPPGFRGTVEPGVTATPVDPSLRDNEEIRRERERFLSEYPIELPGSRLRAKKMGARAQVAAFIHKDRVTGKPIIRDVRSVADGAEFELRDTGETLIWRAATSIWDIKEDVPSLETPFNPAELAAAKSELLTLLATREVGSMEERFRNAIDLITNKKEKGAVEALLSGRTAKRPGDTQPYSDDDRKEIQKNLRDELNRSEVGDTEKQKLLDAIKDIKNEAEMMPIYDRIYYSLKPKKSKHSEESGEGGNKKGGGKAKEPVIPEGTTGYNPQKGEQIVMERLPDGRLKYTKIGADGKVISEKSEGDARGTGSKAWDDITSAEQDAARVRTVDGGSGGGSERPLQQIPPQRPAAPLTRFFRRLFGVYERDPILQSQLQDPNKSERERAEIRAREALTLGALGINTDAQDKGLKEQWASVRKALHLEGVGRSILIGGSVIALLSATLGVGALTVGALAGIGAGKIARNIIESIQVRDGEKGWKATFKRMAGSWLIGTATGVTVGLLTGSIDWSGLYDKFFPVGDSGEHLANATSGAKMPAFFDRLDASMICNNSDNVWSHFRGGMADIGFLDQWGREAVTNAFHRTVDSYGWQADFLSLNGQPLQGVDWTHLPKGTFVNFGELFDNPDFQRDFCKTIMKSYPTLAEHIAESKFGSVPGFIRNLALAYGIK